MKKIPSYQEALEELGPGAMSFLMEMVNQGDPRDEGGESSTEQTAKDETEA
jgi:hypothetical protein